ncbi:MAG: hypothetical protein HY787_23435 [Deltaproteobacteria bacterium]|nr:hypothetical protein [Deltaproteobacteria bacterium]
MSSNFYQPALVCPYTLMEEEALAWSIFLFGQAVLLHPYPLPLPVSVQSLADQEKIQVRSLEQTPAAIRENDRFLSGIKQYVADNPGRGFLKYLEEAASLEEGETQEEITAVLKGRPFPKPPQESSSLKGSLLLCLVHEWMMQEWEVETSLAAVQEQEKNLIQGWRENPEEEPIWKSANPLVLKGIEAEIHCPPALAAWWELKNTLAPEPFTLFTAQQWVWANYYNLDPEESRIHSIPLPYLGSLATAPLQNPDFNRIIRSKVEEVLHPAPAFAPRRAIDDFQKALLELGLPSEGKYRLLFPPDLPSSLSTPSSSGPGNSDPLILLLPALI